MLSSLDTTLGRLKALQPRPSSPPASLTGTNLLDLINSDAGMPISPPSRPTLASPAKSTASLSGLRHTAEQQQQQLELSIPHHSSGSGMGLDAVVEVDAAGSQHGTNTGNSALFALDSSLSRDIRFWSHAAGAQQGYPASDMTLERPRAATWAAPSSAGTARQLQVTPAEPQAAASNDKVDDERTPADAHAELPDSSKRDIRFWSEQSDLPPQFQGHGADAGRPRATTWAPPMSSAATAPPPSPPAEPAPADAELPYLHVSVQCASAADNLDTATRDIRFCSEHAGGYEPYEADPAAGRPRAATWAAPHPAAAPSPQAQATDAASMARASAASAMSQLLQRLQSRAERNRKSSVRSGSPLKGSSMAPEQPTAPPTAATATGTDVTAVVENGNSIAGGGTAVSRTASSQGRVRSASSPPTTTAMSASAFTPDEVDQAPTKPPSTSLPATALAAAAATPAASHQSRLDMLSVPEVLHSSDTGRPRSSEPSPRRTSAADITAMLARYVALHRFSVILFVCLLVC